MDDKIYRFNSGFPGGLKEATARVMLGKKPEELIKIAVRRMLPRSPLGRATYSKLKVYAGGEHPHVAQQPKPHTLSL
jgi:large subunit ribosomal protein L13